MNRLFILMASVVVLAASAACARSTSGAPVQARPAGEIAARVTRRIDPLVPVFQPGAPLPVETVADTSADDHRHELFQLESLLRLYRRKYHDLVKPLNKVKEVEDALGEYRFSVEALAYARTRFDRDNANRPPDAARRAEQEKTLQALTAKEAAARDTFARVLQRTTLGADLAPLHALVVSHLGTADASKDLVYVKHEFHHMLKDLQKGSFDFNKLEDGVHEFRRRLRWFPLTIDALDGLVVIRDDPPGMCPVLPLEQLAGTAPARNRYSNPPLRFPAAHPCTVSRCLLWEVSKTIRDLGRIKDEAEGTAALESALDDDFDGPSNNDITPRETARARAIRKELDASRVLEILDSQLSSCR